MTSREKIGISLHRWKSDDLTARWQIDRSADGEPLADGCDQGPQGLVDELLGSDTEAEAGSPLLGAHRGMGLPVHALLYEAGHCLLWLDFLALWDGFSDSLGW